MMAKKFLNIKGPNLSIPLSSFDSNNTVFASIMGTIDYKGAGISTAARPVFVEVTLKIVGGFDKTYEH